jgi:hypothetical protein
MEALDARSALEAKQAAEAQMARAAVCPPWRHGLFGLIMGCLVATPAFDMPIRMGLLVLMLCLIPVIVHSDRKRTGMFINGYRRGKTRIVVFAILAVQMSLYAVSVVRGIGHDDHLTPLLLGVVGLVSATIGSVIWQRVFVREMGA